MDGNRYVTPRGVIDKAGFQGGYPGLSMPLWLCEDTGLW